ncbi:MAG: outer membrane protein assembly factor BamE [Bacteroidales bacterium]|jgi:hypothetical protein|nr:outer membrane protein assembly factor BamE [Bacteroidales bacterium]
MDIKIGQGIDNIKFGMNRDDVKRILGEPNEVENYSFSSEEHYLTESWFYEDKKLSLSFGEDDDWRLVTISSFSEECKIDDNDIIGINKNALLNLMSAIQIDDMFTEDLSDGEDSQIVFGSDAKGINFLVKDDTVVEIQFGPLFKDEDTIIWPE